MMEFMRDVYVSVILGSTFRQHDGFGATGIIPEASEPYCLRAHGQKQRELP